MNQPDTIQWIGMALFWGVPAATSIALIAGAVRTEFAQARLIFASSSILWAGAWIWAAIWLRSPGTAIESIAFYADRTSIVFLLLIQTLLAVVLRFSRVYMHREPGFRRYFALLFLFQGGLNLMVTASHLNALFAGWECVGLASFLLIGFYHHRLQPVRNALWVYSIYRLCDLGILMSAALEQHYFKGIGHVGLWTAQAHHAPLVLLFLFILSAMGKSAQFPFTSWLPKAMEGPTPSSAAFYGSLSVHAGVFLLIRAEPLWMSSVTARIAIGTLGALTALVSSLAMRIQSNAKAQIAYASSAQVGLIWIELALGFTGIALIHVVANASLRTVQLLLSPGQIAERLRDLNRTDLPALGSARRTRGVSWYALAHQSFYLDRVLNLVFWIPARLVSRLLRPARAKPLWISGGLWASVFLGLLIPSEIRPHAWAILACISALLAFTETHVLAGWLQMSATMASLSMLSLLHGDYLFAVGTLSVAAVGGIIVMGLRLPAVLQPGDYCGRLESNPIRSWLFLGATLAWSGFPGTPAFFGEDALIGFAIQYPTPQREFLVTAIGAAIVIHGITTMRLWAHCCWGRFNQFRTLT